MAFFFSQTTNQAVCHTEEAIKTSAITITWTTKFVTMLCSCPCLCPCSASIIKFTPEAKIFFFVGKDMLQIRSERNFLENGNLIC